MATAAGSRPDRPVLIRPHVRGEFELIELFRERIAAAGAPASDALLVGSGDDAAVSVSRGATVISVDAIVEGVHFERPAFPPQAVGAKAVAVALSDLAAMAATPGEAYVQLGLPRGVSDDELIGLADGLGAAAARYGVAVAGGDVVASPVLFLAVTAVGRADSPEDLITRSGASEGDVLLLTGAVGGAAAGLLLLQERASVASLGAGVAAALRARQLEPEPRIAAGRALAEAGARAMIDLSDGLAGDVRHLAAASELAILIEAESVPVQAGVREVAAAAGHDPSELALAGGEDYELLAAVPEDRVGGALAALRALQLEPAVVGRARAGQGVSLRDANGRELELTGFDQLRPPPASA